VRVDREHEGGVALQLHVGDHRHSHAVLAVVQVDADGRLLQHHRQAAAQVVHDRAEAHRQVVVDVGAEARHAARVAKARQLSGQPERLLEELPRMQHCALRQVREHRLVAVDGLQQHEVGDLGHAAGAALRHAAGQRLAALAQQAQQLVEPGADHRMARHVEQRRQHRAIEQHLVVDAALEHARDAQRGPGVGGLAGAHQPRVELAQLQHGGALAGGVGVGHLRLEHAVAHQLLVVFGVGLARAGAAQRQREHHGLVAHARRDVDGLRQRIDRRHVEHGAVAEHAHRTHQRELAERERGRVDLQFGKAPGIGRGRAQQHMPRMVGMALALLQVLRLQQHPLAPHHFCSPTHPRSVNGKGAGKEARSFRRGKRRANPP
jgi:hypothetical protein